MSIGDVTSGYGQPLIRVRWNYRRALATLLPALILSYVTIFWPLIYFSNAPSPDISNALSMAPKPDFALNKLFFPLLFLIGVGIYAAERPRWSREALVAGVLMAIVVGFCMISSAWAILPSRAMSQGGLLALLVTTIALSCQVSGQPDRIYRYIFWVFAAIIFLNLLAVIALPPTSIGHKGIYSHKNALGFFAAMGMFFALYGILQRERFVRLVGLVILPISLGILYLSQSKTSLALGIASPLLALGFILLIRTLRVSFMSGFIITLIAAFGFLATLDANGVTIGDVSTLASGEPTFTGRTDIWEFAMSEAIKRPTLGYGFRSFWDIGDASPAVNAPPGFVRVTPHGHNGYIDMILETGYVGLSLFILVLCVAFWRVGQMDRLAPDVAFLTLCMLIFASLQNFLESTWLSPLDTNTIILLVLLFAAPSKMSRSIYR